MVRWITILHIAVAVFTTTASLAQPRILSSTLFPSKKSVLPGDEVQVAIQLDIEKGWHINAHKPLETSLIPTEVLLDPHPYLRLEGIRYPTSQRKRFEFSQGEMAIYEGRVLILMDLIVSAEAPPGEFRISGKVKYQACDDRSCLLPMETTFSVPMSITTDPKDAYPIHTEIFKPSEETPPSESGEAPLPFFAGRGVVLSLLIIFLGGLSLNLTPCVYPLIPITIGFFVAQGAGSSRWVFLLSLFYVLGMACTYSILGTAAALTGGLFGSALQNPIILVFIACVLVGLSLSMFGAYEITLPAFLNRIAGKSAQGVLGALIMGLTVGILAAPCIGPFIIGLLSYVGQQGDPVIGFRTFFVLALGMGTPFLFLGVLSGSLNRLPRSGEWLVWVKKIFGFVMLGMAVYFMRYLISNEVYWLLQASIAAGGSLYLGWIDASGKGLRGFRSIKWATGITGLLLSSYLVLAPGHLFLHSQGIQWLEYDEKLLQKAIVQSNPVIIDFTADWCIPCRELEERTFSSPVVIAKAKQFLTLRVDLTHSTRPESRSLMEKYRIQGVPTVVFFDQSGNEIENLRFHEVIGPKEFARKMEQALRVR